MIVWKKGEYYYAGTIKFILGITSPLLCAWCFAPKIGEYVNGRRITRIIEIGKTAERYSAILELDKKLTKNNIPHELKPLYDGYVIRYYNQAGKQIGDVVEHRYSYGSAQNRMEAMGFDFPDVEGWLDVNAAFELFERAHRVEELRSKA